MKASLHRVCMLAVALTASGCQAKEDERRGDEARVTATSEPTATEDVTDERLGFELVHPGPGWKLFPRADAMALSPGAAAAALSPHEVVGVVHASRLTGSVTDHVTALCERMPLSERELTLGATAKERGGEALFFDVKGNLGGAKVAFSGKAVVRGDVVYDVVAWAPADGAAAAEGEAEAFLGAFELTGDGASAEAVAAEEDGPGTRIGADWAIRDGRYRDFDLSLTVTPPDGFTTTAGADAIAIHPDARLILRHRDLDLVAMLTGRPRSDGDAKAHHERVVGAARKAVSFEPGPARDAKLGEADARATDGRATVDGEATGYRVVTAIHGEHELALWIWGPPKTMEAESELVDHLGASVRLEVALPAVEATTAAFSDHRLGFTLTTPSGWAREDLTPPPLEATGAVVRWDHDGRWIAILAAALPAAPTRHEWMVSFLEQLLRDELSAVTRATASRGEEELAGRPGTHVSWRAPLQSVDATLVHHRGIVYAVMTVDHDTTTYDMVKQSFALLP